MTSGSASLWSSLYKYKVHHAAIWVLYFLFWMLMQARYYPNMIMLLEAVTIYFVFQATLFYLTAYCLFPVFLYRQRYVSFAALFLSSSVVLALIQGYVFYLFYKHEHSLPQDYTGYWNLVQTSFINTMIMVGLMSSVKLVIEKMRTLKINLIREQQRLEGELQFLRAQVNPHFLFNSINSVYFLIKKDPEQAAETLIRLSDLLRFQLYDCSDEKIDIEKEVEYLQNFITLEKTRRGEKVKVTVDTAGVLAGFHLSPFILMPFVENAFKHVSNSSTGSNEVLISLRREGAQLHALIENTTERTEVKGVGGIGLKNVKRRLELLYPGSHLLTIREEADRYYVQLTMAIR
jgi:two-component system LytT family sensor kinase